MIRFPVTSTYDADCVVAERSRVGEIYHVARNSAGGATMTPVVRYFAWRPEFIEGYHSYWRIDCFIRKHKLSPSPVELVDAIAQALIKANLCEEPIWVSAHSSDEIHGKAFGEVFEFD
ncbi:MAG TPA: hypothetical protein VFE46_05860 [Pirellulales bacterium]|jgi:hypothetical protein|nr:hypothetical protein [Pirellulales bacterium]